MEEEFYSTIKLISGEEIIAKVCYLTEENSLLLDKPKVVNTIKTSRDGEEVDGFILKDWINSSYDEMFIIKMEQVITMTELDKRVENYYIKSINNELNIPQQSKTDPKSFSKRMGYLGSVKETKKYLEDIFNKS